MLTDARLHPEPVRITVELADPSSPPVAVNYCAAEAIRQPGATSLDVRDRAIVMVFEDGDAADEWTPLPECRARPLRVRNVIAVPTHGRLSRRLRAALHELEER